MGRITNPKSGAVLLISLIALNAPMALAQGATDLLSAIKASKVAATDSVQVATLRTQTIVTLSCDNAANEEVLRGRAVAIAKLVAEDKDNIKPLTVLFQDHANKMKEISFAVTDLSQLATGNAANLPLSVSEAQQAAETPAAQQVVHASLVGNTDASNGKYQVERAKLVSRLEGLKARGVGITPFVSELKRIDDTYSHGAAGEAITSLGKLDNTLNYQEKYRHEMQAARPARVQPVAYRGSYAPSQGGSVADYNGSLDGFVTQMVAQIAQKEVGNWMPAKGPFLVERFRIAKRIHELEAQRARVDGVGGLYRNMESLVASKDPRRLGELSMDIKYLQAQLGLSQLEGGLHQKLSL
ncbi:MAG: hypothetical protein ACRD3W_32085 [Terriglobales bacterium]